MSGVVIARADDEIVDLIDRVRSSADPDVALVVPNSSQALQTPLNVRLLAQFSHQSGRRTSIVTEDPRVQQLARSNGLQVYGSVPAYERGIELGGPRVSAGPGRGLASAGAGGLAAAAVLEPPPLPPPSPPPVGPPAHAPATTRLEPRRGGPPQSPAPPPSRRGRRRRPRRRPPPSVRPHTRRLRPGSSRGGSSPRCRRPDLLADGIGVASSMSRVLP